MTYDRTQPKIYEEKCNVQMLTLVTPDIKAKTVLLAEKLGITVGQLNRNLWQDAFEKYGVK